MSELTRNKIDYFVVCVNDFADAHGMSYVAAFDYLKAHRGIEFLSNHYDIEHTYSIEEAVADLAQVCIRNGGAAPQLSRAKGEVAPGFRWLAGAKQAGGRGSA